MIDFRAFIHVLFIYYHPTFIFDLRKSALFLSVLPLEDSRERSDWIGYILLKLNIKNIKYYKKIIFKYIYNTIKLIFNGKIYLKKEIGKSHK